MILSIRRKLVKNQTTSFIKILIVTGKTYRGQIIYPYNESSMVDKFTYKGYKTRFLQGMTLPDKYDNCLIAIYYSNEYAHIYCEALHVSGLILYQQLPTNNAKTVTKPVPNVFYIYLKLF